MQATLLVENYSNSLHLRGTIIGHATRVSDAADNRRKAMCKRHELYILLHNFFEGHCQVTSLCFSWVEERRLEVCFRRIDLSEGISCEPATAASTYPCHGLTFRLSKQTPALYLIFSLSTEASMLCIYVTSTILLHIPPPSLPWNHLAVLMQPDRLYKL